MRGCPQLAWQPANCLCSGPHCASFPGALSVYQTRISQTAALLNCLMLMMFSASGCLECWLSKHQLEPHAEAREVCRSPSTRGILAYLVCPLCLAPGHLTDAKSAPEC